MKIEWMDIVKFTVDRKDYYCLWYEADKLGFVKEEGLLSFKTALEAREYAREKLGYKEELELLFYDIDSIERRLNSQVEYLGLEDILDFWNISMDLSSSLDLDFKGRLKNRQLSSIYDRLFFGQNMDIFSEEDPEEDQGPDFTDQEIQIMEELIRDGLGLFKKLFN